MLISRKRSHIKPVHPLVLNGENLVKVDSYKYLGILLTSDLSWSFHISDVCAKVEDSMVLQTQTLSNSFMYQLRDCIWNMVVKCGTLICQKISQHWKVCGNLHVELLLHDASYDHLLEFFELQSLEERRLHAKLSILFTNYAFIPRVLSMSVSIPISTGSVISFNFLFHLHTPIHFYTPWRLTQIQFGTHFHVTLYLPLLSMHSNVLCVLNIITIITL